jgi:hypothetical protein
MPITPTTKYVTSKAAQIRGTMLMNMKVNLKNTVFNFSLTVLLLKLNPTSSVFILLRTKYITKDRKARTNIAVDPTTANH